MDVALVWAEPENHCQSKLLWWLVCVHGRGSERPAAGQTLSGCDLWGRLRKRHADPSRPAEKRRCRSLERRPRPRAPWDPQASGPRSAPPRGAGLDWPPHRAWWPRGPRTAASTVCPGPSTPRNRSLQSAPRGPQTARAPDGRPPARSYSSPLQLSRAARRREGWASAVQPQEGVGAPGPRLPGQTPS